MGRAAWTDERLDDLALRMDAGFARVDADIRELRAEMRQGFAELRAETRQGFASHRSEFKGDLGGLRAEFEALRLTLLRVGGGIMIGLVGVIAAILVRGV
jgi:hypothetical protein